MRCSFGSAPQTGGSMDSLPVSSSDNTPRRGIDRRQLLRSGVWAAPVLLLATPAPASAASAGPFTLRLLGPEMFFSWNESGQRTAVRGTASVDVVFNAAAGTISGISLVVRVSAA